MSESEYFYCKIRRCNYEFDNAKCINVSSCKIELLKALMSYGKAVCYCSKK
ncbi:hypothetical protein [Campylobacter molothri]|uniref:hypothetical protein n=1 Tax=Campylobacter molothri TaxID=1032242 RepID=UPI00301BF12D|nr:hypothetical protein [Campylobacter sp. W0067]